MSPDRTIVIPSLYMGQIDATLTLDTADGERGDMALSVAGEEIARGEDFQAAQIGPSLLEMSDADLAAMFGSFLSYALESSDPGARDGWSVLEADSASDWADALTLFGEEG